MRISELPPRLQPTRFRARQAPLSHRPPGVPMCCALCLPPSSRMVRNQADIIAVTAPRTLPRLLFPLGRAATLYSLRPFGSSSGTYLDTLHCLPLSVLSTSGASKACLRGLVGETNVCIAFRRLSSASTCLPSLSEQLMRRVPCSGRIPNACRDTTQSTPHQR